VILIELYSELSMARDSREGDHISDVFDTCAHHDEAFETEAETTVRVGTELAQFSVPPVILDIESLFYDHSVESLEVLLSCGAADEFTNTGD